MFYFDGILRSARLVTALAFVVGACGGKAIEPADSSGGSASTVGGHSSSGGSSTHAGSGSATGGSPGGGTSGQSGATARGGSASIGGSGITIGGSASIGGSGNAGTGGADPCPALLAAASAALQAAQTCNLSLNRLQCTGLAPTVCGCPVIVESNDSSATQAYLAALKAVQASSCVEPCSAIACVPAPPPPPGGGRCYPTPQASLAGTCVSFR